MSAPDSLPPPGTMQPGELTQAEADEHLAEHARSEVKLWSVYERRPLEHGRRKVTVFRYITVAASEEEAIERARKDWELTAHYQSTWSAVCHDDSFSFNAGCFHEDATDDDRAARKREARKP